MKETLRTQDGVEFTPIEEAIYRFYLFLQKKERTIGSDRFKIKWEYGIKTDEVVEGAGNYKSNIPDDGYTAISLWIKNEDSEIGNSDIRIYNTYDKNILRIFANMGTMNELGQIWKEAFENEEFPVIVEDRHGFSYQNQSHINSFGEI